MIHTDAKKYTSTGPMLLISRISLLMKRHAPSMWHEGKYNILFTKLQVTRCMGLLSLLTSCLLIWDFEREVILIDWFLPSSHPAGFREKKPELPKSERWTGFFLIRMYCTKTRFAISHPLNWFLLGLCTSIVMWFSTKGPGQIRQSFQPIKAHQKNKS